MIKTISKIGNSQGLVFDSALMKLTNLNVGDKINLEIHSGGTITITPMEDDFPSPEKVSDTIESTMEDYAKTMDRLS